MIRDRTPDQLKMVYALWPRQAVAELIRDRYGIKLAMRTVNTVGTVSALGTAAHTTCSFGRPVHRVCAFSNAAARRSAAVRLRTDASIA